MKKCLIIIFTLCTINISAQRPIIRKNLGALAEALNEADSRSDEALSYRNGIENYFYKLITEATPPISEEAYNEIRALKDNSLSRIESAAKYGDYSRAWKVAKEEYNEVIIRMREIVQKDIEAQIELRNKSDE